MELNYRRICQKIALTINVEFKSPTRRKLTVSSLERKWITIIIACLIANEQLSPRINVHELNSLTTAITSSSRVIVLDVCKSILKRLATPPLSNYDWLPFPLINPRSLPLHLLKQYIIYIKNNYISSLISFCFFFKVLLILCFFMRFPFTCLYSFVVLHSLSKITKIAFILLLFFQLINISHHFKHQNQICTKRYEECGREFS